MKIYTIRDIAQQAGVSVTTVSRVLNGRPDVSKETQAKVRKVMAECHFVGNANARGLKQADQAIIAVIIRGRNNPFLAALAEEMLLSDPAGKAAMVPEYIDEQDDEFLCALNLLFCAQQMTGRTDFSSFGENEMRLIFTRYNASTDHVTPYGEAVYGHYLRYRAAEAESESAGAL